jgi:hypothetical protein
MLKKIVIPLIILVVLVSLAIILKSPAARPVKDKKVITNFEPGQVARIEIAQQNREIVILKADDKWLVATSQNYPANQEKVADFLSKVSHLKESDIVSKNQEKHFLFQVDSIQGRRLKIYNAKNEVLADFYVGKMGPDYMSTYIRLPDANDVISVDVPLMWLASVDSRQWLDRVLFKCDAKDIVQIVLRSNTITDTSLITLSQDEKQEWSIITPSGTACNKTVANELAGALCNLSLDNVAPITGLAAYGLEQPERSVTIICKNAFPFTLLIGKITPTGDYYAKSDSSNFVVMVNKNNISKLNKKLEDFIPPKPLLLEESKKEEPKEEKK